MNILVMEDRAVALDIEDVILEMEEGHKVLIANGVRDARSHWEYEKIDVIIADLNFSTEGLEPEEAAQTQDGRLTGWVWLREYVFKNDPKMKKRTIIYSDYTDKLYDNVAEKEYAGITIVPKKGATSTQQKVVDRIREISSEVSL